MNLLKAAIHPVNFCTSWRLSGGAILVMADTFSGLGSIPHRETIYPSNFPEGTPNVHFSGVQLHLEFLQVIEGLCQVRDESFFPSLDDHIINIHFSIVPELAVETLLYTPLVHCTCSFEAERHCRVIK
jgi:hypothetical protein